MVETKQKKAATGKVTKKQRRRRNYDDLDEAVNKQELKKKADTKDESDSEVDDAKLDAMVEQEDELDDDLAEIDTTNIIQSGRRTRGKIIDYKKTAEELDEKTGANSGKSDSKEINDGDEDDEEEEEEDADFKE